MKNTRFASTLALAFCAGTAFAADLPSTKAPPYAPPPPMWTGFYAGINAGYAWGVSTSAPTVALPLVDNIAFAYGSAFGAPALANTGVAHVGQDGFIGGGQIGYNYQWSPKIVLGLEADMQGSLISGRGGYASAVSFNDLTPPAWNYTAAGGASVSAGVDWFGTVRGRLGYLFTPDLLVFGTGGLVYGGAYARVSNSISPMNVVDAATGVPVTALLGLASGNGYSDLRVGWTAGGGLEWLFAPNTSLKLEALYYDLGSASFASGGVIHVDDGNILAPGAPAAVNVLTTRVSYSGVIARAGVNYHFNWGGAPVVAKY